MLILFFLFICEYIYEKILSLCSVVIAAIQSNPIIFCLLVADIYIAYMCLRYWKRNKKYTQETNTKPVSIPREVRPERYAPAPIPREVIHERQVPKREVEHPTERKYASFENTPEYYETQDWKILAGKIRKRDNFTCQICGVHGPRDRVLLHVHHIKPRGRGGPDEPYNLVTLCASCHAKQPHHDRLKNKYT